MGKKLCAKLLIVLGSCADENAVGIHSTDTATKELLIA
jgi:hypothetical protein